jgi:hypothetical protein
LFANALGRSGGNWNWKMFYGLEMNEEETKMIKI